MDSGKNDKQQDTPGTEAELERRLLAITGHQLAKLGPLLEFVDELLRDAQQQYDLTAAVVLRRVRERLVAKLEEAVESARWIDVSTAAEQTRRPEGTIRYWCRTGKVKARRVGPRAWEIDSHSLFGYDEAA
jgi:hypothetical protein